MTTAIEKIEPVGPMELMRQALATKTSPEIIRELVALQQSVERFAWEREERQAKIDFDNALNACQKQIGRIVPNRDRENGIKWADYMQIDATIRPVYVNAAFSICFSEMESLTVGRMRMCATVSRGGISREYFAEIPTTPANSKTSQADAHASAASRVKRYLMLDIFNIAIGIDADEKEPFTAMAEPDFVRHQDAIKDAPDLVELQKRFAVAYRAAGDDKESMHLLIQLKDEMKEKLRANHTL